MTVARYYTPNGRSIQAKGIVPDVTLPASPNARPPVKANSASSADIVKEEEQAPKSGRKEVDLEGHIEANDLTTTKANLGFASDIDQWPAALKNDYQLKMGYTYLRSWARFAQN
jgi:carboxyl-terminal processing protease